MISNYRDREQKLGIIILLSFFISNITLFFLLLLVSVFQTTKTRKLNELLALVNLRCLRQYILSNILFTSW